MRSNRLGCLTGTGILEAIITALVIAGYAYASGGLMYSPGPLNAQSGETLGGVTSHAQTGGDCKACHIVPWKAGTMADRCADCHGSIANQMKDVASLHGKINQNNPVLSCWLCHPEHRGADAPLTALGAAEFPHEALGFSLAGHQLTAAREAFTCDDCHLGDISTFAPDVCQTCHRQMDSAFALAHSLEYGDTCLDCHDGVDRFGKNFRHDFAFQLAGKHDGLLCSKCHTGARDLADFSKAPIDCNACHQRDEPHEGKFGTDCAVCHTSDGWTPAEFDHSLAAFKLEGKHAEIECEQCHTTKIYKGTPTDCYSCHQQEDEHGGKFGTDCAACHQPASWENVTFDHARSNFPLNGAHVAVACEDCHINNQFQGLSTACVTCHDEPTMHAGQFGTDCIACHNTTAWIPAEFTGKHTFPLEHGDGATCATCHPSSFAVYTCYGCHEHNEAEVNSKHLEEGISNFQNCMECHPNGQENDEGGGGGDRD